MDVFEVNSDLLGVCIGGFVACPSAIAIAMRYLQPQPGNTYEARSVADPETGLTVGLRDWYDLASGTRYRVLEALYGFTIGITSSALVMVRSDA